MESSDSKEKEKEKEMTPPEAALQEILSGDLPNTYLAQVADYEEKGDFESAILLYQMALYHLPSDSRLITGMYGALLNLLNEKNVKFCKDRETSRGTSRETLKETSREIRHLEQTLREFERLNNIPSHCNR